MPRLGICGQALDEIGQHGVVFDRHQDIIVLDVFWE